MLTPNQREFKLQVAGVKHIRSAFPGLEFIHVPNRPGDGADGHFKKMLGARPGVSDLLFTWNDGALCGGLLELKTDSGRVSNDQNRFMSAWARLGWRAGVARTVREIHDTLKHWGHTPKHESILEPDYSTWEDKIQAVAEFYAPC